jgi:hypothetical protein
MSSAISDIQYNEQSRTLTVSFTKGGSHTYDNVDPATVAAFKAADSKGAFFNANIRELPTG